METRCVPFKMTIEGQEIKVYILEKDWELVYNLLNKNQKKTGYERAYKGGKYYVAYIDKGIRESTDSYRDNENSLYENAAYYSDKTVAENNARADRLMRQLRRFAVEHRNKVFDWTNQVQRKSYIYYGNRTKELLVGENGTARDFGVIYFDSEKTAKLAIETFKDELIWYFTEYKDSL